MKTYLSRKISKFWSSEFPVGDPTGGVAYGEKNDPATLAIISAVGTGISVIGALNQGQQAKNAAQFNAQQAQNNALASRQQAEANAAAQQRAARLKLGSMRAAYGASGITMEGSAMDVLEASAATAELDRQNILYGGELKSGGYQSTAGLELMRGENAETGSYFSAGSALLSGAAKAGAFASGSDNYAPVRDAKLTRVER
jgi:hypothetical protein